MKSSKALSTVYTQIYNIYIYVIFLKITFLPCTSSLADDLHGGHNLIVDVTGAVRGRHTFTHVIEVSVLGTATTVHRCIWQIASMVNFAKRAAGLPTAGLVIGVLHIAWTILCERFCTKHYHIWICFLLYGNHTHKKSQHYSVKYDCWLLYNKVQDSGFFL